MVRVRIAPSPTGNPHVGTAFVGIINLLFATSKKGVMVLRVEDTDQNRSTLEYEQKILKYLNWIGITWHEGPDVGGGFGPYRQSERFEIYKQHIEKVLLSGHAYKCFCTQEDLLLAKSGSKEKGSFGYNGFCRNLSVEEVSRNEKEGKGFVIRLKTPSKGLAEWHDLIKGFISFPYSDIDDQILMKSDGMPTYHFANVVDDHLMKITHVIRGEEWISSTPKHIYLYEAFRWDKPLFGHLPLLLDASGKKLSKRKSPVSIQYYEKAGFDPACLLNFLVSISYTEKQGKELYDMGEIVDEFDIKNISKSSAVFDVKKLEWLSKARMAKKSPMILKSDLLTWVNSLEWDKMFEQAGIRAINSASVMSMISYACAHDESRVILLLQALDNDQKPFMKIALDVLLEEFGLIEWDAESIKNCARNVSLTQNIHFKQHIISALFISMYGMKSGLPVFATMELLGKDVSINRMRFAQGKLDSLIIKSN